MDEAGPARRARRAGRPTAVGTDVAAALALVLAPPVVAWATVGDLSEQPEAPGAPCGFNMYGEALDYLYAVRPPDLDPTVATAVAVVATVLVPAAVIALVRPGSAVRRDRRWIPVLCVAVVLGAVLGGYGRMMTAGTCTANLAGVWLFFLGPVVAPVGIWAVVRAGWLASLHLRATAGRGRP